MFAPIVLFVYNRLHHTMQTVEALQKNDYAKDSVLYIFCDGSKDEQHVDEVMKVQEYVSTIDGFKDIHIEKSSINKGLANSVISGVTKVICQYGKVIVVEDDIITQPFFLRYMNACLDTYYDRSDIFMIGGYNYNFRIPPDYMHDVYVVHRSCSWGWATWKDRWLQADWNVSDYQLMLCSSKLRKRFNRGGSDMFPMLKEQMKGNIDSWAIRWDYCMYKHNALCVHPIRSLCYNAGFDGSGVHCGVSEGCLSAPLYDSGKYEICLAHDVHIDKRIARIYAMYHKYNGRGIITYYLTRARNVYLKVGKILLSS